MYYKFKWPPASNYEIIQARLLNLLGNNMDCDAYYRFYIEFHTIVDLFISWSVASSLIYTVAKKF